MGDVGDTGGTGGHWGHGDIRVMGVEGTLRDQETWGAPQAQGHGGTGDMGHEDSGGMGDTRGGDGEGEGDAGLCLQFAFLFYLLTYVGAVCNGLTLLGAGTAPE